MVESFGHDGDREPVDALAERGTIVAGRRGAGGPRIERIRPGDAFEQERVVFDARRDRAEMINHEFA